MILIFLMASIQTSKGSGSPQLRSAFPAHIQWPAAALIGDFAKDVPRLESLRRRPPLDSVLGIVPLSMLNVEGNAIVGDAHMQRLLPLLISTVLLSAQAPPDSAAYSVAYVDILPASRTAAITAIKLYRDASRKDDGFQRIEFFEQAGRPAHFCILETWANSHDLDTHAAAASVKDFRNKKIDSLRLSDYDQRPYKTLSFGHSSQ